MSVFVWTPSDVFGVIVIASIVAVIAVAYIFSLIERIIKKWRKKA
jgi:uncharacterized membrane-anchored protein